MPRTSSNAPKNENASQKFVRLANQRVNRLLAGMKGLGQLGGKAYTSTPDQRKAIAKALRDRLDLVINQLEGNATATTEFKL